MNRPLCINAVVNLSDRTVELIETPQELIRNFLGGRGLNVYYLYKYLKPRSDPLSPDNVLILGAGLLTGTIAPNTGRHSVSCKSPESGILGDSNIGGFFGPEMRFAGFDRLIILGKADAPAYLYLEDGKIEIRDASPYWGLTCNQTERKFRYDLGSDIEVECIGPAGEKMVRFACTRSGIKNAAGRCGTGAVWGSKNLKAVVARGTRGLPVKDPQGMIERYIEIRDYLQQSKVISILGRVGTPLLYDVSNYLGAIRTHNSQQTVFFDTLNAEEVHKYVNKMLSCYGCVVHCRHRNALGGEGPEYTAEVLLGANIGVADTRQMIDLNNLVNDLGLDVSSTGTYIAWAIELFERGYLKLSQESQVKSQGEGTGTPDSRLQTPDSSSRILRFGDYEMAKELIYDIAYRRGLGDMLAEGSRLVDRFGPETADFLIAIKGLPQSDPHDVRYLKAFALGIATSSRGADHLRSRPTLEILDLPASFTEQIYGEPVDPNPTSYRSKARVVTFSETIFAVIDCLGICKFVCHGFNSPRNLNYDHFRELVKLATGLEFSKAELVEVGRRVINLERLINYQEKGIARPDDTLPARYFDEPMPSARAKGSRIDRQSFSRMLDEYYALHGWDKDGMLPPERVAELNGLRDIDQGSGVRGQPPVPPTTDPRQPPTRVITRQRQVYCRPTLCSGCRICANACAIAHDGVANPRLGRIAIHQNLLERYEFQELCRHCEDAPCIDACMVGCIAEDEGTGIITNDDRCAGCWMCVMVCPYGGMVRDLVKQVAIKCDQCKELTRPVCVAVCPNGALVYEEREDARAKPFFAGSTVA